MVTTIALEVGTIRKPSQIVEMNWDPITRIVGSLGLYLLI
jgi:hydrogenase large subunit